MQVPGVQSGVSSLERLRCVIVENGSLPLAEAGAHGFEETVVIAQMHEELPAAFADRITERLASLERSGKGFESAVLMVSQRRDAAATAARQTVVGRLSRHVRARNAQAELTLLTGRDVACEHRADLLGLAETLMALPISERVPLKLRFGQPPLA